MLARGGYHEGELGDRGSDGYSRPLLERRSDQQLGVGRVAHVPALDQDLGDGGQVQPCKIVARLQAVDAVIG